MGMLSLPTPEPWCDIEMLFAKKNMHVCDLSGIEQYTGLRFRPFSKRPDILNDIRSILHAESKKENIFS